ncbi:MAG: protease inhibitor I42 family protein [Gammaproteobacteria bacterium]|nr:protease inhibitor I42 family protein [Gammaproteobacteria bacterium]
MRLKTIILSFATLLLSSQSHAAQNPSDETAPAQPADHVYSEAKQSITVTSDQPVFTIKLKSNPTTGYAWFLRDYNHDLITPVKHSFTQPEQKLIGAPSYEVWVFKAKPTAFTVPHQTTIRMVYARPWSSADNSTQLVFSVSLKSSE